MMQLDGYISDHEVFIRGAFFLGMLAVMAAWEMYLPRREYTVSKRTRWINNISLVILDAALLRLIFPAAAVGVALYCQQHGWGLLHYWQLSPLPALVLAVVVLDLAIYLQHVMFHAVPLPSTLSAD